MNDQIEPEFSYIANIKDASSKGKHYKLRAEQEQCDALAKRFGLVSLTDFHIMLEMKDEGKGKGITLRGKLFAVAHQVSGSSEDGLKVIVDDIINIRFLNESKITPELEEENMMTLDSEDLEVLPEDVFDLGELMSQYLGLSVDPFLSDGFILSQDDLGEGVSLNEPELSKPNPFAVLSQLRDKLDKG